MALAHVDSHQPVELYWRTSWDFFSGGNGSKSGFITDLAETGCTLKTSEAIEFRRWIRMIIRDTQSNVCFTAVGRVIRCENSFEASSGPEITLYRYKVEFTYPVDLARLTAPTDASVEDGQAERASVIPLPSLQKARGNWELYRAPDVHDAHGPTSA